MSDLVEINFDASPTLWKVLQADDVVTGVMGPFGSGKSVCCSSWVMKWAGAQPPGEDGIRHSRWAVIRNTAPELKSTTIKTFVSQFPEGPHGRVVYTSPITYHIKFPKRVGHPGLDCEILFIALDQPKDVRKLLSLELTGAWVNEAREVPRAIVDALTGRLARYPAGRLGQCVKPRMVMDTNAPDEGHWWQHMFEGDQKPVKFTTPDGAVHWLTHTLYRQPPAVLELERTGERDFTSKERGFDYDYDVEEVIEVGVHDHVTYWGVNPEAENLPNLHPLYYPSIVLGKTKPFIRVYAQGRYDYVEEGKPVVPEFNAEFMVRPFPILEGRPILGGIDIGGGTLMPAAVIMQRHPHGNWMVHSEVVAKDMGVDRFSQVLKQHIIENYPAEPGIDCLYTDPAGEVRDEIFETKVNEWLRNAGFPIKMAPSQDWRIRRLAIAQPCNRMVNGQPGLLVHPRCKMLISGLKGKWDFRRMQIVGTELYSETPSKNEWSHVCEALGYGLLGGGEYHMAKATKTTTAGRKWATGWEVDHGFNVLR